MSVCAAAATRPRPSPETGTGFSMLATAAAHLGASLCLPCRPGTVAGKQTMRAAVYHSFSGPIKVEDVAIPVAPAGGVVVEVKATGVCRSDWHGWKGHDSDIEDHGLPFTPGHGEEGPMRYGSSTCARAVAQRGVF